MPPAQQSWAQQAWTRRQLRPLPRLQQQQRCMQRALILRWLQQVLHSWSWMLPTQCLACWSPQMLRQQLRQQVQQLLQQ
jgi:hypothetical protein